MKKNHQPAPIALALCMAALLGCSSNNAIAPSYFLLSNSDKAMSTQISGTPQASIRNVNIPDYLNKTGLARLLGGGKVSISLKQMWAEKLSRTLPTLIANEIKAELNKPIATHPLPPGVHVKTNIDINIERLIADTQQVYLQANYQLLQDDKITQYEFYITKPLADESDKALIEAHNQAIYALSKAIAQRL